MVTINCIHCKVVNLNEMHVEILQTLTNMLNERQTEMKLIIK